MKIEEQLKKYSLLSFVLWLFFGLLQVSAQEKPKNILMICVDGLRPELNCYGKTYIKSPNIDKLAKEGVLFENAYCNITGNSNSKVSIFTGIRPKIDKFSDLLKHDKKDKSSLNVHTLPSWLKSKGYFTMSIGKTVPVALKSQNNWSEPAWLERERVQNPNGYINPENLALVKSDTLQKTGNATEVGLVRDGELAYMDDKVTSRALTSLDYLSQINQPYFLTIGFRKPFYPFTAPKKYWDLYDRNSLPMPSPDSRPQDWPLLTKNESLEFSAFKDIQVTKDQTLSVEKTKELIHGYAACVSYVDDMIGQIMNHLVAIGQDKNTIVLLVSEGGMSLGEHNLWGENAAFDVALKSPLIVKSDLFPKNKRVSGVVELIDVFPTICDVAGVEKPLQLQGESLLPMLTNHKTTKADNAAYVLSQNKIAIKTPESLFVQWYNPKKKQKTHQMLFDHIHDAKETKNVVKELPYKEILKQLEIKLINIEQKLL